jgi:DNA-binding NtrC family response regulator/tetratricopeptide (TPR) repeat protein
MLLADRFLRVRDCWFDIATAEPVHIVIQPAGRVSAQIAWAERCAMLSRLRHPMLNPLLDYGAAGRTSLFEAYALLGPLSLPTGRARRLVRHARRFLEAHGIALDRSGEATTLRRIRTRPGRLPCRPIGLVLQPRNISDPIAELISGAPSVGARSVRITATPGAGLRTLVGAVAQLARMQGFVPLCPQSLLRWPALLDPLTTRHICLLAVSASTRAEQSVLTRLFARLGLNSTRAHICLTFHRGRPQRAGDCPLLPMGTKAMMTMVYVDGEEGPEAEEMFRAARRSEGLPGRFLSALGATADERPPWRYSIVREARPVYEARTPARCAGESPSPRSRLSAVLGRAVSRAGVLEGKGRHAAAARLLQRAAHVLHGRGEALAAARCWLQLGWLARSRGAVDAALGHAQRARDAVDNPAIEVGAGCLSAVCWTDQARLVQAEAALRAVLAAAAATDSAPATEGDGMRERCVLGLARVLYWQGRHDEAMAISASLRESAEERIRCEALLLVSRGLTATGDLPGALRAARDASRYAAAAGDLRLAAAASRVLAEALCAAGDADGVRTHVVSGLEAAAAAHLPLSVLRLRIVLLRALKRADASSADAARLVTMLQRAVRRPIPTLFRQRAEDALQPGGRGAAIAACLPSAAGVVEAFLEIAQRSKDDVGAVTDVATALCERVGALAVNVIAASDGRVIATAGRPWRDRSAAGAQALSSGRPAGLDDPRQPREAAEPVRCGGQLVGALACRWVLGAVAIPGPIATMMKSAALAMATHLRAIVEGAPAEPPPSVWGDLLGESAGATALRDAVLRASRAPFPVLIEGESGSGKELVARAIHRLSPRHARRFCAVNCAALSDDLLEAELFGHARGAFTGAVLERAGLFEEADGGTLFLDEIGELAARAQAKLLRVLQEGEIRRVGENLPRRVDVRIVAATNRCLEYEAAHGRFRTDLRFRLDVLRISVPPLRERVEDIPLLAQHFWRHACSRLGTSATLGPDALAALSRYDWPGNVRELQNAIAWMAVHAPRRGRVSTALLPAQLASRSLSTGSFEAAREEFERRFVRAALAQAGGHRQVAARALGISRQGLAKMLRRLGIEGSG